MVDNKYNGWTNYATWRVNLEMFDGDYEILEGYNAETLKSIVEEMLEHDNDNTITLSYALAFINDVNWYEIAQHINRDDAGAVIGIDAEILTPVFDDIDEAFPANPAQKAWAGAYKRGAA